MDSGSSCNFIDSNLVQSANIPRILKSSPISVLLADNSTAASITHETIPISLTLVQCGHCEIITLDLFNSGSPDFSVILGLPWLQKHNPSINWSTGIVDLPDDNSCSSLVLDSCSPVLDPSPCSFQVLDSTPVGPVPTSSPISSHSLTPMPLSHSSVDTDKATLGNCSVLINHKPAPNNLNIPLQSCDEDEEDSGKEPCLKDIPKEHQAFVDVFSKSKAVWKGPMTVKLP